jgi:hypothetical protein
MTRWVKKSRQMRWHCFSLPAKKGRDERFFAVKGLKSERQEFSG